MKKDLLKIIKEEIYKIIGKSENSISNIKKRKLIDIVGEGWISKSILNGIKFDKSLDENHVNFQLIKGKIVEAKDFVFEKGGGMIIFSTDVNAIYDNKNTFIEKIRGWLTSKFKTIVNRITANSKITNTLSKFDEVQGFSIGNFFRGKFFDKETKKVYNESSLAIEIIGIDSKTLELIASEIAKEFEQKSVLVKDIETNEIYLADRN